MYKTFIVLIVSILLPLLASGCTGLRNKQVTYISDNRYPPYTGKVKVFWKEHGVPSDPNTYEFIGTVSAMPFWAGIYEGKLYAPLHKYIVDKAAEIGGNAVIIYCGELGTVADAQCYGDVLRMK